MFTKSTSPGLVNGQNPYPNLDFLKQESTSTTAFENTQPSSCWPSLLKKPANTLPNSHKSFFVNRALEYMSKLQTDIFVLEKQPNSVETQKKIRNLYLLKYDIQEVILQNSSTPGAELKALNVLVTDLWNAFRLNSSYQPTRLGLSPLAKWGQGSSAQNGPYTLARPFPTENSDWVQIVSLPGRFKDKGVIGWTCLAHEISHDILEGLGSNGLISSLRQTLLSQLPESTQIELLLKDYFINRISETAADVLGVLLLGPAAGIGLIGYLRSHGNFLSCSDGDPYSTHPVAISRVYLVAYAVNQLFSTPQTTTNLPGAPIQHWNKDCEGMMNEMIPDLGRNGPDVQVPTKLGFVSIPSNTMSSYAKNVVEILVQELRKVLSKTWDDSDNEKVDLYRQYGLTVNASGDSRHKVAAIFFNSLSLIVTPSSKAQEFIGGYIPQLHVDHNDINVEKQKQISVLFRGMIVNLSA